MKNILPVKIFLSQTISRRKSVINILFEISRLRVVEFKIVTEMECALKYKQSDIKYMFVRVPESCLKLG